MYLPKMSQMMKTTIRRDSKSSEQSHNGNGRRHNGEPVRVGYLRGQVPPVPYAPSRSLARFARPVRSTGRTGSGLCRRRRRRRKVKRSIHTARAPPPPSSSSIAVIIRAAAPPPPPRPHSKCSSVLRRRSDPTNGAVAALL